MGLGERIGVHMNPEKFWLSLFIGIPVAAVVLGSGLFVRQEIITAQEVGNEDGDRTTEGAQLPENTLTQSTSETVLIDPNTGLPYGVSLEEVMGFKLYCGTLGKYNDGDDSTFNSAWDFFRSVKQAELDMGGSVVVVKGDEVTVREIRSGVAYTRDARLTQYCVTPRE